MDDSPTVSYFLEAENTIDAWLESHRPMLVVRCRERRTNVYVVTGTAPNPEYGLFNEASVRVRFDDSRAQRQVWSESTDNDALFAPNPIALARRIAKSQTMRFEFTPFNSSAQVVEFDVRGFEDHPIREVAKTCGWTP